MTKARSTKKALLLSALSVLICLSMLIGTTFAWFTDSVTSANNIIKSGNLDVELEYWNGTEWVDVNGKSDILTNELWEPGVTEVAYLRVANAGSLALKYQLGINIVSETDGVNVAGKEFKLSDYIQFGVVDGIAVDATTKAPATYATREAAVAALESTDKISAGYTKSNKLYPENNIPTGVANAVSEEYIALVVFMPTTVGNEANHNGTDVPEINLGINVLATQFTSEIDSFSPDYDADAEYPIAVNDAKEENKALTIKAGDNVTLTVPADAPAGDYTLNVDNKAIALDTANGTTTVSYDINLYKEGVKVANDGTAYEVSILVGEGLDIAKVDHNGTEITAYTYANGIITFTTNSFSPFSVVYKNYVETAFDLQAAINNAEDGTLITIAEGVYNLPAQIQIDNKSVTIAGEGNVVLNGAGAGSHVFQVRNAYVNGVANSDAARDDLAVTFKNLTISGSYKSGIMVRNDIDVTLEDIIFNGTPKWSHLQVENSYDAECADFIATIRAKNVTTPKFSIEAGAGHKTYFYYEDCQFGELQVTNLGGEVYVNGALCTPGTSTYCVSNSDELVELLKTVADGSTIMLAEGEYSVRFTNNTAFNVDNLYFVGIGDAKLSVSSSEVSYGRIQGDNVVFDGIHFTNATVGATGKATYNNCTFDGRLECASSNGAETYANNCTMNSAHTSSDMNAGNAYFTDCTIQNASYSQRSGNDITMTFVNCTIDTLTPWNVKTVLKNCDVTTINTEHMSDKAITNVNKGDDGIYYATTSTDEDAVILYDVPADYTETTLTIPSNVTDLGNGVFWGTTLETVTIPASVTDFGASGVSDTNASGGAFKSSNVTKVVLEEGMTEIPAAAFNGATKLTTVNIPSTVKTIGVNAFRSTAITSLTVPSTVTTISYGAFRDMTSLETVTFEGSHVDIPNYAFRGCTNLRKVYLNVDTATIGTNMAFCNASSNNSGTNNITFYCKNEAVAELVKTSMGVGSYVAIYVGDTLWAEIK